MNKKEKYKENMIPFEKEIDVKGGKLYEILKRLFDFGFSFVAILVLAIPMLIIGILVITTSKGPMIYKSKRVGRYGKIYTIYKFRSMRVGADLEKAELEAQNEMQGVTFKMKNDPRITKFGKFLRKTSLDELPQLFNVLVGDLSLIGPRSLIVSEVEAMDNRARNRLLVQQGLSGEWQTHGRSNTTYQEMIDMDLDYIQNKRGFWYDVKLVFLTIKVVLTGKGAE